MTSTELTGTYPPHMCGRCQGAHMVCLGGAVPLPLRHQGRCGQSALPYTNSDESPLSIGAVGDGIRVSTQSNMWSVDGDNLSAKLPPIPQKAHTADGQQKTGRRGKFCSEVSTRDWRWTTATPANVVNCHQELVLHDKGRGRLDLLVAREARVEGHHLALRRQHHHGGEHPRLFAGSSAALRIQARRGALRHSRSGIVMPEGPTTLKDGPLFVARAHRRVAGRTDSHTAQSSSTGCPCRGGP